VQPNVTRKQLEQHAASVRRSIITMLEQAGSGHTAGALGLADIMTALYFAVLHISPESPDWDERDLFVMSNGHCAPVLYATLAERGFFPRTELATLRQFGSRLQGHPERQALPGVETTSGPLGSGLSQASGMAYHVRYLHPQPKRFVYCLMGDGELDEGNIWEAAMFASKYNLGNLIGIVDRNNIQIGGSTEDVMPLEDLRGKWRSFGWHVQEIDGHNMESICEAMSMARAVTDRPSVIIAHTIPGKGVDFMEGDYHWHGKVPTVEEAQRALAQLEDRK
jgi:transketolase domain protein